MRTAVLLVTLAFAACALAGCEPIEGVFKAGIWVGVIAVVVLIGVVTWVITKMMGV
jgi:hypothetical protein